VTLLLTGATGFVGMELLARLVKAPAASAEPVLALIRADDDAHATRRLHETLRSVFGAVEPYAGRVTAVAGDLERPGLGIDPMLAETVSEIIHGAASVSFELALDRSRAINLEGTRRVLMFARRCPRLRRLTYLHRAEGLPREGQREDRRQERDADDDAGDRARQVVTDQGHALQEHDASPEVQGRVADDHRRDLVLLAVVVDADAQGQAPEEGGEEGRAVSSR